MAKGNNIDQVLRKLNGTLKKQIPFAIAKGLTDTADDVVEELTQKLPRYIDRPTPFTRKAFARIPADKKADRIKAVVFIKRYQEAYLSKHIEGGSSKDKTRPVNVKLNKYGNIPSLRGGRKIAKLLARPDTFRATINGVDGIWQRGHISKRGNFTTAGKSRATNIRLLMVMDSDIRYTKSFPFYRVGKSAFYRNVRGNMRKAVLVAIRTAR